MMLISRKVVRKSLGLVFAFTVGAVIILNVENLAVAKGWDGLLSTWWGPMMDWFNDIQGTRWFWASLSFLFGLFTYSWADFLVRKYGPEESASAATARATALGEEIINWTRNALDDCRNKVNELPRLPDDEARDGRRFDRYHEVSDERKRKMAAYFSSKYSSGLQIYFIKAEEFGFSAMRNDNLWYASHNYQAQLVILETVGKLLAEGRFSDLKGLDGDYIRSIAHNVGYFS